MIVPYFCAVYGHRWIGTTTPGYVICTRCSDVSTIWAVVMSSEETNVV